MLCSVCERICVRFEMHVYAGAWDTVSVCVRERESKQSSSVLTLYCVSVMPHFLMIPMRSVPQHRQLVLAQRLDPDPPTSHVLSSLSEFSSLSSNYLKIQYTWCLWCCRDRHTVWAVVEKMEERDREGGNTRVDAADEKTITQLYHKLVLGSWSCSQSQIHSISDMFVLLYPDCYCR